MGDVVAVILVACEESQAVCKAFRGRGVIAYSCDLEPCSGGFAEWHLQMDALAAFALYDWDMVIAFPPCTHLAVSGARWFEEKRRDGRQQQAVDFFRALAALECSKIAIENPVGIMSSLWRSPDQIIQPWQFGHPETKATCLWLKGLPRLLPTKDVREEMRTLPKREANRVHFMPPSPERARLRSQTYAGIAAAMAEQWL